MSRFGPVPVVHRSRADKLAMCSDLHEGRRELRNYADCSAAATSGHVLTDIPGLLEDVESFFFLFCLSSVPFCFCLSPQSYANRPPP